MEFQEIGKLGGQENQSVQNRPREERIARRDSSWVLYKFTLISTNEQKIATWMKKLHKSLGWGMGAQGTVNGIFKGSSIVQIHSERAIVKTVRGDGIMYSEDTQQ